VGRTLRCPLCGAPHKVHAERLVHKLDTFTDENRAAQSAVRELIWQFYRDLKAYQRVIVVAGLRMEVARAFDLSERSPEHLKERDPAAFGRVLGLDRAPEVKTLRRRLSRLAAHHCAEQLGAELARVRVNQRGQLMGFLYIDGHVRAYHGQRPITSRAYVARRHLAMPASTDYWINDRCGDPLFVITGEVNAALTKALPRLLREVRDVVGERRVTIVFDRGGSSPKLFRTMINDGFDVLTYRVGRCRRINERRFMRRRAELDGRWVDYLLHDQAVRLLKGKLRLRQVCEENDGILIGWSGPTSDG
jgi:Transposase protein